MRCKATFPIIGLATAVVWPTTLSARQNYSYSYAHIRYLEGDVEIQRVTEPVPSEAGVNLPIMSGDRAWTRIGARAEIQYGDDSILRMDERTRVDFVDFGEQGDEVLVRQWSGSIILRVSEEQAKPFRVDTPAGTVYPASVGLYRIDVHEGGESVVLSVYDGVAELASETGSVLVRSGQRSIVEPGRRPEPSFAFNTAGYDDFSSWSDDRDRVYARTEHIEGVPPEVDVYTGYLSHHGTWRVDVDLGPIWYPSVSVGWYPYHHGRWIYTWYGWTWVSYEPWGWAPYHYGRWGYNHFGWYWIPGAYWGPAWVSWAIGPSWIGWCPLGYYDRPLHHFNGIWYRGGKAVPRGSVVAGTRGHSWSFVRNEHFASRSLAKARLRTADIQATAGHARLLESGAVLDRGFQPRVVGAAAMTRLPRGGLAELRDSLPARGTEPSGRSLRNESGALETGRARSRYAPSTNASPGLSSRPGAISSELRRGSPRTSSSPDQAAGARYRTESPGDRSQRALGQSERSSLPRTGAIQRSPASPRSSNRSGALSQGTPVRNRGPQSSSTDSAPRQALPESGRSERQPGSIPDRSSVSRRIGLETPGSPEPSRVFRRTQRPPGGSREPRGLSASPRRSRSLGTPSQDSSARPSGGRSSSSRGREIFSRMTRTRPSTSAPARPPRGGAAVRSPSPRSPAGSMAVSKPNRSSSSSRARTRPKKNN